MNRTALQLAALLAALPFAAAPSFAAEKYPTKPIRLIVPYPPGGTTDLVARGIAVKLAEKYGQQVVIDNRGGASTIIGTDMMAKAAPDGYTFGLITQTTMSINPNVVPKLPYDTVRDLAPITQVVYFPYVIAAHPSVPFNNMKEMIAQAKAKPGSITYGTPGTASTNHLGGAQLEQLIGAKLLHVPFKGAGPALIELVNGRNVQVIFDNMPSSIGHVRSGTLRALGVTTAKRSSALPDVPTIAETIPGFEASAWFGMSVPKGVPPAIIAKLNKAMNDGLNDPKMRARLAELGGDPMIGTPKDFWQIHAMENGKWAKAVKISGAKVE